MEEAHLTRSCGCGAMTITPTQFAAVASLDFLRRTGYLTALNELFDLSLALDAQRRIGAYIQPFGGNLLAATLTDAVFAFLDGS